MVNWATFPPSANLASWFRDGLPNSRTHTAHNKHEGIAHHQPGGTATFACGELVQYFKQKGEDFRSLGRWCLSLIYADPHHRTQVMSAYNIGHQSPKGCSTIYQHQLWFIQKWLTHNSCKAVHYRFCDAAPSMAVPRGQAPYFHEHE